MVDMPSYSKVPDMLWLSITDCRMAAVVLVVVVQAVVVVR